MSDDFSDKPVESQQKQTSSEHDGTLEKPCTSQLQEECESENKNSENNQRKRSKHNCPYPECKSSVVHLPWHMRKSHEWNPKKSRSVLNLFGLRKLKNKDVRKTKRTYKSVMCPIVDCQAVVKHLHNHLMGVHKMKTGSKTYKKCLKNATRHDVEPIFSSNSASSTELSDASSSSSVP